MEGFKGVNLIAISAVVIVGICAESVRGQITTPCTASMIMNFTPCFNSITGSSSNGSSPTSNCCSAFRTISNTSVDCACLLITANVPIQFPINIQLLLRACNMSSVPFQCKASGTPLASPGTPAALGPSTPPPIADSPFSPQASKLVATLESETSEELTPLASPPVKSEGQPTKIIPGVLPVLTPSSSSSASNLFYVFPSFILQFIIAAVVSKSY